MKLTVIGAGSSYTPELASGLIKEHSKLPFKILCLNDIDSHRLKIVGKLICRMFEKSRTKIKVVLTLDLKEALKDSDFIITQIRVGGLKARLLDEEIPLEFGCIGQETTGAGGFSCALRTIPVMLKIAKLIEKISPRAFLINFTNPVSIITEAVTRHSKVKVVGLCNIPIILQNKVASLLKASSKKISLDCFGLNHLSFIRDVIFNKKSVFDKIYLKITKNEFDSNLIKTLKLIPSPYLRYYYYPEKILSEQSAGKLRAKKVLDIERKLFLLYQDSKLTSKPKLLEKRGGALYSQAAINLIKALLSPKEEIQIINLPQGRVFKDFLPESVFELPFKISNKKIQPLKLKSIPLKVKGLIQAIKTYEELTIQAAVKGEKTIALQALLSHRLIGDFNKARGILNKILKVHKEYLSAFTKK